MLPLPHAGSESDISHSRNRSQKPPPVRRVACVHCRQKHHRCDGNPPDTCSRCRRCGLVCRYVPVVKVPVTTPSKPIAPPPTDATVVFSLFYRSVPRHLPVLHEALISVLLSQSMTPLRSSVVHSLYSVALFTSSGHASHDVASRHYGIARSMLTQYLVGRLPPPPDEVAYFDQEISVRGRRALGILQRFCDEGDVSDPSTSSFLPFESHGRVHATAKEEESICLAYTFLHLSLYCSLSSGRIRESLELALCALDASFVMLRGGQKRCFDNTLFSVLSYFLWDCWIGLLQNLRSNRSPYDLCTTLHYDESLTLSLTLRRSLRMLCLQLQSDPSFQPSPSMIRCLLSDLRFDLLVDALRPHRDFGGVLVFTHLRLLERSIDRIPHPETRKLALFELSTTRLQILSYTSYKLLGFFPSSTSSSSESESESESNPSNQCVSLLFQHWAELAFRRAMEVSKSNSPSLLMHSYLILHFAQSSDLDPSLAKVRALLQRMRQDAEVNESLRWRYVVLCEELLPRVMSREQIRSICHVGELPQLRESVQQFVSNQVAVEERPLGEVVNDREQLEQIQACRALIWFGKGKLFSGGSGGRTRSE